MTNSIFKGDDTSAFGNSFITITVKNKDLYPISKILVVTNGGHGITPKTFTDEDNFQREDIELVINYTNSETLKLNSSNTVNVVAYDINGLQNTCPQTLVFYAKNGVLTRCQN